MAGAAVKDLIAAYRPVHERYQAVQQQLATLDADGVTTRESLLRKQLLDAMVAGWPYPWDDAHTAIKKRTGWGSYEIVVVDGATTLPPDLAPSASTWLSNPKTNQYLKMAACAVVSIVAARGLPAGCDWPSPIPIPTPSPSGSSAYNAGRDFAKTQFLANIGKTFQDTGAKVAAASLPGMPPMTADSVSAIQVDHVSRLMVAVKSGEGVIGAELAKAIPLPTDYSAVTADQWKNYAQVFTDFGKGMQAAGQ